MSTSLTTTDVVAGGEPIVVKEGIDSVQVAKYAGIGVVAGLAIYGGYRILTDYILNKPVNNYPQYGYYNGQPMPGYYYPQQQPQAPVYSYKDANGVIRNAQTQQPIYTQQPVQYVAPQAPTQPAPQVAPTAPINNGTFVPQQ